MRVIGGPHEGVLDLAEKIGGRWVKFPNMGPEGLTYSVYEVWGVDDEQVLIFRGWQTPDEVDCVLCDRKMQYACKACGSAYCENHVHVECACGVSDGHDSI